MIRSMSEEIRSTAPDARVLTTYYCGMLIYQEGWKRLKRLPVFGT